MRIVRLPRRMRRSFLEICKRKKPELSVNHQMASISSLILCSVLYILFRKAQSRLIPLSKTAGNVIFRLFIFGFDENSISDPKLDKFAQIHVGGVI